MKKIVNLPVLTEEQCDDAAFRAKDLAWSSLASVFDEYARSQKLTYEKLGARIRRSKSHVQRWLSSPFNMSLRSLGLLAEALDAELVIALEPRAQRHRTRSRRHPAEQMLSETVSSTATDGEVPPNPSSTASGVDAASFSVVVS